MTTLICNCNQTMPLDAKALSSALDEDLTLHTALCRRQAAQFQRAVKGSSEVIVACTQEQRLFSALASETEGARGGVEQPLHFVNIRETAGWSAEAGSATPKIAALLAAARLPPPEPVPTVTYKSQGRLLIIGALNEALQAAESLKEHLQITLFSIAAPAGSTGEIASNESQFPMISGQIEGLTGWLGAFKLQWRKNNPIDLDLCSRCNACVAACPEGAIGADYQVNLSACQSHRACVAACEVTGAIDFSRDFSSDAASQEDEFDLVLDLSESAGKSRWIDWHAAPQGYFFDSSHRTILGLRELVGEFEKPKFFTYKQKICAHTRNEKTGCSACIDVCSAHAVSSDRGKQGIKINPHLCVGCGACTTVCPSGALSYAYPKISDQGVKIKTLLSSYAAASQVSGNKTAPALLLHSQGQGAKWIESLGRAASLKKAKGMPAHVIPMGAWHTASCGIELWLSAIAFGAQQIIVLTTEEEAPEYLKALSEQMQVAQALLHGLGYSGSHVQLLGASSIAQLDDALQKLKLLPQVLPSKTARYALPSEKRSTLELALDHLITHAPQSPLPDSLPLPKAGSPWGTLAVDKDKCTLCLSCINACPAAALQDNTERPQLKFIEKNCVQCGLCEKTCPENAISLVPRMLLTKERGQARVLNEQPPYQCIRCAKPFGTLKAIEAMLGKLSGHAMFQGEALNRLKMCGDCRVIDIHSSQNESQITNL